MTEETKRAQFGNSPRQGVVRVGPMDDPTVANGDEAEDKRKNEKRQWRPTNTPERTAVLV